MLKWELDYNSARPLYGINSASEIVGKSAFVNLLT